MMICFCFQVLLMSFGQKLMHLWVVLLVLLLIQESLLGRSCGDFNDFLSLDYYCQESIPVNLMN